MQPLEKPLAHPRRPALLAGSAAVAGCAVAAFGVPAAGIVAAAVAAALCGACALLLARGKRHVAAAALGALAVGLSFAAYSSIRAVNAPDNLLEVFPGEADLVRIEGVVIEGGNYIKRDPAAFEYPESPQVEPGFPIGADPRQNVSWILAVERLPDMDMRASGLVKLYAPPDTQLELHSRVSVVGKLRRPRRAGNPGELDSRARYQARGITHTLTLKSAAQAQVLQAPSPWDPRRLAPWVHGQFHSRIGARMSRDRAAVLGATLLGERGNLSPRQRSAFVKSGTIHVLVVSGLHVGLLAAAVLLILRLFGMDPRKAWAVAGVAALAYLFITGLQPSVLRATAMVVIYALGHVLARRPDPLNVLGASAVVTLAINPGDVAELGFQLSYLSVLGILVLAPALRLRRPPTASERALRGAGPRARDWTLASLRISLAVGLCTWPLLAYTVHVVSPAMFVTNLLVGPLLTVMLGVALLSPLAFFPFAAAALAWVLSMLAGLLELIAFSFAEVPGGHLFVAAPPAWWLIGYYAALALLVLGPRMKLPRSLGAGAWLAWLCALPLLAVAGKAPPGPALVTALDVGQGQCVVIEVAGGPCAVLDCGSTSMGGVGERVLAPYLWQRGRRQIDVLLISHADADHVNGLPQLFERFPVGCVYVSELFGADETGEALIDWLAERTEVRVLRQGDELELATGLRLRCLWPDVEFARGVMSAEQQRNDAGLVLELTAGGRRVLLPSDVEAPGLAGVLPRLGGPVDVLFAPHQGSAVEGLPDMLAGMKPGHVVLSARESFPADDALAAYQDSGATLWRTWGQGAVSFELGADGSVAASAFLDK